MFIEVATHENISAEKETINLELVKRFKSCYVYNGGQGTIFYFNDKTQIISTENYDTIKKRIKKEAQKQTSVISRFELMEVEE